MRSEIAKKLRMYKVSKCESDSLNCMEIETITSTSVPTCTLFDS